MTLQYPNHTYINLTTLNPPLMSQWAWHLVGQGFKVSFVYMQIALHEMSYIYVPKKLFCAIKDNKCSATIKGSVAYYWPVDLFDSGHLASFASFFKNSSPTLLLGL